MLVERAVLGGEHRLLSHVRDIAERDTASCRVAEASEFCRSVVPVHDRGLARRKFIRGGHRCQENDADKCEDS